MKWLWIICILPLTMVMKAQDQPLSYTLMDQEVRRVWDIWEEENNRKTTVRVWRVLVVGVESRRILDAEIRNFEEAFPDMDYDWSYEAPFYKLKVGATQKRLDIKPLLYTLKESYPSALEIRDDITFERYFEIQRYEP
jgi:hypothetical protein